MGDIVVAFAPEDRARGDEVLAALRRSGASARPGAPGDPAALVLWSRHAARRGLARSVDRAALLARLDPTPPPPGLRAYRAADLRAWRGRIGHPAWTSLLRKLRPSPPLALEAPNAPPGVPVAAQPPPRARPLRWIAVLALLALLAAAGLLLL